MEGSYERGLPVGGPFLFVGRLVGLEAKAVDLIFEGDGGGAQAFDAGGGDGYFGEVVVAEGVDGVEAGAGLGGGGLLRGGDGNLGDHAVDLLGHADDALKGFAGLDVGPTPCSTVPVPLCMLAMAVRVRSRMP
jgi:hypothetical protein